MFSHPTLKTNIKHTFYKEKAIKIWCLKNKQVPLHRKIGLGIPSLIHAKHS